MTLTVARNSLGSTFGGYAVSSWSLQNCIDAGNEVITDSYGDYCYDHTAAGNFIFRLAPESPIRIAPSGDTTADTWGNVAGTKFQCVRPDWWPAWGNGGSDLRTGSMGSPGQDAIDPQVSATVAV